MNTLKSWKLGVFLLIVQMTVQVVSGAIRTVAKDGSGQYESIQDAINESDPNDIVEILDDGVYEEQVNIDSTKTGLTLRGVSVKKPTIKFCDTTATFPKTLAEAKDTVAGQKAEKEGVYFDQNGAVRLLRVQKVTIENIIIDGDEPFPFYGQAVWGQSDLFHGSAGLVLWISGDAVIRNCEIRNAYFGIAIKDRNIGGVFANINPNDNDSTKNVPLSGFGKTGNHLFEQNRIHDNSWGMFIESAWDRGSTVRYNLFYENHHYSSKFAEEVSKMGVEGAHQCGGAVLLKDIKFSPVAFHNNTFWHNTLNIGGQWQVGAPHLIFNNIFGPPDQLWSENELFGQDLQNYPMDIIHPYRLSHNLFSVMLKMETAKVHIGYGRTDPATNKYVESDPQEVKVNLPIISEDLRSLEPGGCFNTTLHFEDGDEDSVVCTNNDQAITPGAKIKAFPSDANNRWYEVVFKSTDPESPDFLVPDWGDSLMYEFVVDQGDPTTGILDADGSIADLGAIPFNGDLPKDKIIITPTQPAFINGKNARISFKVHAIEGSMTDPEIKFIRWIHNIPDNTNTWGKVAMSIPESGIVVPTGDLGIDMGSNTLNLTIPGMSEVDSISFFEIIVEGTGSNGKKVTSAVGFVPYRQLQYKFVIEVFDVSGKTKLDSVVAGEPVMMKIKPERIDGTPMRETSVDYVELALGTIEYKLKDDKGNDLLFLNGVPTSGSEVKVMFTRVPSGGMEMITATGMFDSTNSASNEAIAGASDPIRILPGKPAQIKFQDPPSDNQEHPSIIQRGEVCKEVTLFVFDKYGNKTIEPADVSIKSLNTKRGNFTCDTEKKSDENGEVIFECLTVIDGAENDTFSIEAKLDGVGATDKSWLKLGKITDMFVIYYDTVEFNSDTVVQIDACTIDRVPIIIRAMAYDSMVTTRQTKFQIAFDKPLVAYSSDIAQDPITEYSLVDGETVIWLQSSALLVENGKIEIKPIDDSSIMPNQRTGINFKFCENPVKIAYYYADKGNGAVNKVEVHFEEPINKESLPDTLVFYWPNRNSANGKRIVTKDDMKINSKDSSIVNITLDDPFDKFITVETSYLDSLGDCINYSKEIGFVTVKKFPVKEKIGPLLMSAVVMERLTETGNDILYLTFSEPVNDVESLVDNGLNLIKDGELITLEVLTAEYKMEEDTVLVVCAVVKNRGNSLAPQEGDSLSINPKSSVKDLAGNPVHEKNRPVVIMQRDVPPDILDAFYYDRDGNGIVDRVVAEFNKKVKLENISAIELNWGGKKIGNIKSTQISFYEDNETKIEIKVNSNFKDLGVKTSGSMWLALKYSGASEDRTTDVTDKAAPVISKAVYCPGAVEDSKELPDTFHVTFSEKVKEPKSSSLEPFLFYSKSLDGKEYEITLKYLGESGNTVKYLVKGYSTSKILIAENGDSVRIKAPKTYRDENDNWQTAAKNRLVSIEVKSLPIKFSVKSGPNPFVADGTNHVKIVVDPQAKMLENVKIHGTLKIYDALGTVIYEKQTDVKGNPISFSWDGRNQRGRFVGSGTYLAIVEAADLKGGKKLEPAVRLHIGIKR